MKNRTKSPSKLDVIAAAVLIGVIGAQAMSQVLPPMVYCPPGEVTVNGTNYPFGSIVCPPGYECGVSVEIGMSGSVNVKPICIPPRPPGVPD